MTKKMAIVLIILGSLLLITGLALALRDIKPMHFNVIAGIIILIGSFFGLFGKQLQDKNSSEKSDKILKTSESTEHKIGELRVQNSELTEKSDELKEKADKQAQTIDKLRAENTELYSKLANASKEIYDNIQGGQDAVFVQIDSFKPNEHICILRNDNKYPVYELLVEITNYDDLDNCKSIVDKNRVVVDYPCFLKCSNDFKIQELGVGEYYLNDIITKEFGKYQIRFKSRNKIFYQQLFYKKINGIIYTESRLFEVNNGKSELIKSIASKNKDLKVDFDKEFSKGIVSLVRTL